MRRTIATLVSSLLILVSLTVWAHSHARPLTASTGSVQVGPHFIHAWNDHRWCGAPVNAEHVRSDGYHQRFQHCQMHAPWVQVKPLVNPTPVIRPTPIPTAQPTQTPNSPAQYLLDLINSSRAQAGLPSYALNAIESAGTASCPGATGHAQHMASMGQISHDQFPADICVGFSTAGENVGAAPGSAEQAAATIHQEMMNEGPSGGHYQNLMSSSFRQVGIGFAQAGGYWYVSEDFVG